MGGVAKRVEKTGFCLALVLNRCFLNWYVQGRVQENFEGAEGSIGALFLDAGDIYLAPDKKAPFMFFREEEQKATPNFPGLQESVG